MEDDAAARVDIVIEDGSRRRFLEAIAAGLVASSVRTAGASPRDPERRLLEGVQEGEDLHLLQQMIRMKSYSEGSEEAPLARFLVDQMKTLGLDARLQEVTPGRFNAVGVLKGTGGGRSLMLNGHIDTNPVGVGWTVDPLEGLVRDGFVFGIGVSNMKASCAAFFGAARALVRSGVRLRGDLVLTFVVGELRGGDGTNKIIAEGIRTDGFIVGEPTDLAVLTLHAAGAILRINTLGVTRHMSKLEESVSAIDTMYLVIERLKRMRFSGPDNPEYASVRRLNVGTMRAGLGREYLDWRVPQVPDFATIKVAVRFGPGQTAESVLEDVRRELDALHREDPRVVTEVLADDTGPTRPYPFEVPRDAAIVKVVAEAHVKALGRAPRVGAIAPYRYYGTDASQLQHVARMSGVVCGVGGKYNTMPDERVELSDFHGATRLYGLAARAFCG